MGFHTIHISMFANRIFHYRMFILLKDFWNRGEQTHNLYLTMLKTTFFAINFIGLFFLHLFSINEVTIENFAPDSIKPGEKTLVEVTINKGQIQGFAKMEIIFPTGFIATPAETNGASFTYSDQKVRFVWMTLPTEETFTVSYYLECPADFDGKYEVKGNFAYIKSNERIDYAIPTKQLFVRPDSNAITSTSTAQNETAPDNDNSLGSNAATETATTTTNTSSQLSNEFTCERVITKVSETEYGVNIRVKNSNIKGFAKIVETCPNLSKTEKIQDAGSTVTPDKNTIKFVWFEIPNSPVIEVSYKFTLLSASSDFPVVNGKISFVENNNPKEIMIQTLSGDNASNAVAATKTEASKIDSGNNNKNTTETKTEPVGSNNANTASNNSEGKKTNTEEKNKATNSSNASSNSSTASTGEKSTFTKSNTSSSKVTTTPEAEVGISYKVQIMAAHRVVNKSYFKQRHGFSEDFNIENHEGWVKYTTGRFGEYKMARNERERLRTDYATLPGPFVTAYNNGDRITVQEALLISKQQWYK